MEIFKLFGSIFVNTDEADKSIQKTEKKTESFASKLGNGIKTAGKWGAAFVAAANTAAMAIGGKAVSAASDFETSFAKVNTLLSDTTDLDAYKKAILSLSNQTGISTDALCESIYSAISASVDESNAIEFVSSALKLAEGGFTDAATAVDVMTTAINAYGLSADDAAQISDYLITTQNLGKTSVGELASSLGKVIPVAAAYGVQMDDLSASMAIMTKNGIATAEASTYTKAMLNELGKSSSTVSGILKEKTGKSFAELEAEGYSLGGIIAILGESVNNDASAFNELWSSSTAAIGALSLMGAGAEEYNNVLAEMRDSTGATEKAYETMHDTFVTKSEQLRTVATNTLAEIGNTLMPFANGILGWVISNMPLIQSIIQTAIGVIQFTVETFGGILQSVFGFIQDALADAGITFESVMAIVQNVFSEAWDILVGIWEAVGKPLFNALMDAIGFLLDNWESIMEEMNEAFQLLWGIASGIWDSAGKPLFDALINTIGFLFDNWESIAEGMSEAFRLLWDIVSGIWNSVGQPLFDGIASLVSGFSENMADYFEIVQTMFEVLWDTCATIWESIGQPVFDLIGNIVDSLAGLFQEHMSDILSFFQEAMDGIQETWESHLKPVFEAIGDFLNEYLLPAFRYVFENVIKPLVENVFKTIGKLWTDTLKPVFDGICDFLRGVFTRDWNLILGGILDIITGIFHGIETLVSSVLTNIKNYFKNIWNSIKSLLSIDVNTIKSTISNGLNNAFSTVGNVLGKIKEKFSSIFEGAKNIVGSAIDKIKGFFKFEWSLPKLKMPHLKISGSFSLAPPSVPSFKIDWYAKGGILTEPTIFGMNPENGNAMVGGEAGPEAVAPIETLQQYVREAVAEQNAGLIQVLLQILQAITSLDDGLLDKLIEALEAMRFEVKEREFARLVREV